MGKLWDRITNKNKNQNKKDFTKEDLPDNRLDQFFDVLKIRFSGLVTVNLLYIIFILPMLLLGIWIFILGLPQMKELFPSGDELEKFIGFVNSFLLICIPLNTIAGPATAGMYYVLRNWSWGEHASAVSDFFMEFKRSWKKSALYNALVAILIYACFFWICNSFVIIGDASNALPEPVRYILAAIVTIILLLYAFIDVYVYPIMVTYDIKFSLMIKNALLIALARVPQTIAYILSCAVLIVLAFLLWQASIGICLIIGFVLVALAKMLLANSAFDKFNDQLTGGKAPTRRGLAPLKDKLGRVIKK